MKYAFLVGALLLAGCAPQQQDTTLDIFAASATGDLQAVELILDAGGDINRSNEDGATPLIVAALYGQADVVGLLLDRGAALDPTNSDGASALHVAAFFCQMESARLLLEAGADPSATNVRGERPLDTVAGEWNAGLGAIYMALDSALDMDIQQADMERLRPQMADLLREYGS